VKPFRIAATRTLLLSSLLLATAFPLPAQDAAAPADSAPRFGPEQIITPDAQAVIDRMTATLQGLTTFSISAQGSRDEVIAYGYKLQYNESAKLTVQRPNRLRAEISGDYRNRTIVYDGAKLAMYSPDDAAHVSLDAPDTLAKLIGGLLDAGVDLPLIDVLYQGTAGTLTEGVRTGLKVGEVSINGVPCDHLAFRQASVDWQIWVEKGERALPRKMLITTRYQVGDPQWQATLDWDLKPAIDASTFAFKAPEGSTEIPFASPAAISGQTP
jgi:hypothetical protein